MLQYDMFYREFVVRRQGDVSGTRKLSKLKRLPVGAILHDISNFGIPADQTPSAVPNVEGPLYSLEPDKKAMYTQMKFLNEGTITTNAKGVRLMLAGVGRELQQFKANDAGSMLYIAKVGSLPNRTSTQSVINYNPLYRAKITGLMRQFKLFNNVMATVLNNAISNSDRTHFIHITANDMVFTKADFARTFKAQNKQTLKYQDMPYYFFLVQLILFIESRSTGSLFDNIPADVLPKLNFVITNGDRAVVYRLDVLKDLNGGGNQILQKVINQLNKLPSTPVEGTEEQEPEAPTTLTTIGTTPEQGNTTGIRAVTPPAKLAQDAVASIEEADVIVAAKIDEAPLTPAQKRRLTDISQKYKKVEIADGLTVEQLLTEANDQSIGDEPIEGLGDQISDKSMLHSSVSAFNKSYLEKSMAKDIAATLVTFSKQGMFLVDLEKEDKSDEHNRVEEYTARFEGIDGKRHSIKYTLPKVDSDGNCMINGSLKSVKIQRVNTPICMVSPTRVALNTNYNKALVERSTTKAHSFYPQFRMLLDKAPEGSWSSEHGSFDYKELPLPYDYTAIARHMASLKTKEFDWTFFYAERFEGLVDTDVTKAAEQELKYGVFLGTGSQDSWYFIDTAGVLSIMNSETLKIVESTTILDEVILRLELPTKHIYEWAEIVGLQGVSKRFPVIFALCYRFGLSAMLKYLNVDYMLYPINERVAVKASDIVVRMQDQKLIIKGTPKHINLLFSGLTFYDLREFDYDELDGKDVYFDLIQQKKLPIYYLSNIDTVFEMFIDPITRDVLAQMGEPTNMRDLLIRSVVLLSTEDHKPASSSTNYRYRSYELFAAVVYKKLAAAMQNYQRGGRFAKFSVSPYEVMQAIMTDPLMRNVDTINPIADIKETCGFSHIGEGGRSGEAFVVEDRRYPADGVGIMSEATVDSGKVAIDGQLSMDPHIVNTRGLAIPKDPSEVSATELLSVTSLLMPDADTDDGKRANFINIQMSQFAPVKEMHVSRIRTGYERVVAHRTRLPFAYPAEQDGKVIDIHERVGVIKIQYKDGEVYVLSYGQEYSNNGGGGFYVTQNVAINGLKEGGRFKKGDILLYNSDFFKADPYSKQVDMATGFHANVALIEMASTMEDSCIISSDLAKSLASSPVQIRQVVVSASTVVHQIAAAGTDVKSADPLLIFDDSEIPSEYSDNPDLLASLQKLNRKTPKAKYNGKVVKVEAFYRKPIEEMSESMGTVVKSLGRNKNAKARVASQATNKEDFFKDQPLTSDRLGIVDITEDTVILKFYIQQDLSMEGGDKIVFGGSLKSVCAEVKSQPMPTEDGSVEVQGVIAAQSLMNRMVPSVLRAGATNRILEKMEQGMLDIYFD